MPERDIQSTQSEELDLRAYFRPIWRRKWVVLAIVIVAAGGTYFLSSRQTKQYVASGSILDQLSNPALALTNPSDAYAPSSADLANAAELVTSPSVTARVRRILGPAASAGSVSASSSPTNTFITVTATASNPRLTARLANAYIDAYLRYRTQSVTTAARQQLRAEQAALTGLPRFATPGSAAGATKTSLRQQIATDEAALANPDSGAQQVQVAQAPGAPTSPDPKRDAIFGGVVGLVLALIAAYVLELLDRRLLGVASIESLFNRPVLAVLPRVRNPTPLIAGETPVVPAEFLEQLRSLAVLLRLTHRVEPTRAMVVTSTLPQEGKSTLTRDLSIIYAEAGQRVLVIDCDLRRPSMERLFGLEPERGLVHILRDGAPLLEVAVRAAPPVSNAHPGQQARSAEHDMGRELTGFVDVVTHGEVLESPLTLTGSPRMSQLLREATEVYDLVLIDTAPLLAVADTVPLLEEVDGVLLVARLGRTTRSAARRFMELIDRLGSVNLYGIVANDVRSEGSDGYGSYGYYGHGHQTPVGKERPVSTRPAVLAAEALAREGAHGVAAEPAAAVVTSRVGEAPVIENGADPGGRFARNNEGIQLREVRPYRDRPGHAGAQSNGPRPERGEDNGIDRPESDTGTTA
jgi:Mrp family chromosome partitioning ATPase